MSLASNRLAIIDLSPAGHMPMSGGDGWWITYNGEVYNFQSLRTALIKLEGYGVRLSGIGPWDHGKRAQGHQEPQAFRVA